MHARRHRSCLVCLALAAAGNMLAVPEAGRAQVGDNLQITVVTQPTSEVQPGSVLTLSFRVVNLLSTERTLLESVQVPQGWATIAADTMLVLDPGGSAVRLVSFSIPRTAPEGLAEIRYALRDSSSTEVAGEASILVGVAGKRRLLIALADGATYTAAGRSYTSRFALTMEGNVGGWVFLVARSSKGFRAEVDPSSMHIAPGETQIATVSVTTSDGLAQKQHDVLTLAATLEGDTLPSATGSSAVVVLPVDGRTTDFRNRIPGYAALRSAGENDGAGVQAELGLSGLLLPERHGSMDLLVRTPNLQRYSILGPFDEYRFSYAEQNFEVHLGDQTYALSPLTEYGRYSFGAGGRVTFSDVAVGGFYNKNRRSPMKEEEAGGFAALDLNSSARLSAQFLGKQERSQSGITSVRTLLKPARDATLDMEVARSFQDREQGDALSLWWFGRSPSVYYDLRYLRADPKYTGYWRDIELKNANVIVYPWQLLRLEGTVRENEKNLARDTTFYSAPRELFYEFGSGYGNYVFIRYRIRKVDDLLPHPSYQRDERTALLRGGYAASFWSALAEAEAGKHFEHTRDSEGNFHRLALFLSVFPEWSHSYGLTLEHLREPNLYGQGQLTRWAGSISARVAITPATHIVVGLQGNTTDGALHSSFVALEASVDHQFPTGHTVRGHVRDAHYTPGAGGGEFSWLVEYVVPFDLPLGRLSAFGGLSGRIFDADTREGIPEVLVTAGSLAVLTDAEGRFSFPGLAPGLHTLSVDAATLGHGRVLAHRLDKPVLVEGGSETEMEIMTVRSGEISGIVTINEFSISASGDTLEGQFQETGVLTSALIEVSSGEMTVRQYTDSRGRFGFPDLAPGTWSVRILDASIQEGHRLENESVAIQLAPSERREVIFRILPVRRTIRILDTGQLLQP